MVVYKMPQKSYEREDYFGRIYTTLMMMKSTVIGRWYTIGGQNHSRMCSSKSNELHCNLTLHKNGSEFRPRSKSGSISASHVALQEG